MDFEIPSDVKLIIDILHKNGFEAYAVGGCVRDTLLNRVPNDWDITTSALPTEVKALFRKTVDTGLKHGTITVIIHGTGYEVTTYRIDGEYNDCRHPESVTFTANLAEDLRRRDFTINAFVYSEESGVIDLFDGISDLSSKIIRCVGNPHERFSEDALRILRAVRFAAQLGFIIDSGTEKAASELAPNLAKVSAERIHAELEKLLVSANPDYIIKTHALGIDLYTLPSFAESMANASVKEFDSLSTALRSSLPDKYVRWSVLLSFITSDNSDAVSAAEQIMRALKTDNCTIGYIKKFISLRDFDFTDADDYSLRKLLNRLGEHDYRLYIDFMKSQMCLNTGDALHNGHHVDGQVADTEVILRRIEEIVNRGDCTSVSGLTVNGRTLIAAGFPQGKCLGTILEALLEHVLKDPSLNSPDILISMADKEFKKIQMF